MSMVSFQKKRRGWYGMKPAWYYRDIYIYELRILRVVATTLLLLAIVLVSWTL